MFKTTRVPAGLFASTKVAGYATFLIAFLAFALSYSKLFALAERAGYSSNMAHLWPLIVDGLAVVATLGVLRLRKSGYAWFLLIASTAVSVVAAVASAMFRAGALPPVAAALVSIVPPLCLLFAPHLAVQLVREAQEDETLNVEVESVVESVGEVEQDDATDLEPVVEVEEPAPLEESEADVAPALDLNIDPSMSNAQIRTIQREEALKLVSNTTLSLREIAQKVGVSDMSVGRWAREAGINTRERKRRLQQVG